MDNLASKVIPDITVKIPGHEIIKQDLKRTGIHKYLDKATRRKRKKSHVLYEIEVNLSFPVEIFFESLKKRLGKQKLSFEEGGTALNSLNFNAKPQKTWKILRRFNEFSTFHENVHSLIDEMKKSLEPRDILRFLTLEFPSKDMLTPPFSAKLIQKRITAFETYLITLSSFVAYIFSPGQEFIITSVEKELVFLFLSFIEVPPVVISHHFALFSPSKRWYYGSDFSSETFFSSVSEENAPMLPQSPSSSGGRKLAYFSSIKEEKMKIQEDILDIQLECLIIEKLFSHNMINEEERSQFLDIHDRIIASANERLCEARRKGDFFDINFKSHQSILQISPTMKIFLGETADVATVRKSALVEKDSQKLTPGTPLELDPKKKTNKTKPLKLSLHKPSHSSNNLETIVKKPAQKHISKSFRIASKSKFSETTPTTEDSENPMVNSTMPSGTLTTTLLVSESVSASQFQFYSPTQFVQNNTEVSETENNKNLSENEEVEANEIEQAEPLQEFSSFCEKNSISDDENKEIVPKLEPLSPQFFERSRQKKAKLASNSEMEGTTENNSNNDATRTNFSNPTSPDNENSVSGITMNENKKQRSSTPSFEHSAGTLMFSDPLSLTRSDSGSISLKLASEKPVSSSTTLNAATEGDILTSSSCSSFNSSASPSISLSGSSNSVTAEQKQLMLMIEPNETVSFPFVDPLTFYPDDIVHISKIPNTFTTYTTNSWSEGMLVVIKTQSPSTKNSKGSKKSKDKEEIITNSGEKNSNSGTNNKDLNFDSNSHMALTIYSNCFNEIQETLQSFIEISKNVKEKFVKFFSLLISVKETPYDEKNLVHEQFLQRIWYSVYPNEPLQGIRSEQWVNIGFQGSNPATDFRAIGTAGLYTMLNVCQTHSESIRTEILEKKR